MNKRSCKCSVIAGNVVPNPECPVHVEVVRVAPSRSAAPCPKCGIGVDTNSDGDCAVCTSPAYQQRASAAPPSERDDLEQQAAHYFSEIRKFSPLNLDHYSLENWKDFIVWREARAAVPQAAPDREQELDLLYSRNKWHMLCASLAIDAKKSCVADALKAGAAAVPAPVPPEVSLQSLLDAGFNGFAVQLLAECLTRKKDFDTWEQPICFRFGGVRFTLEKERAGATAPPKEV